MIHGSSVSSYEAQADGVGCSPEHAACHTQEFYKYVPRGRVRRNRVKVMMRLRTLSERYYKLEIF